LPGLRERLALYGGTLRTARRPTGGFRVDAACDRTGSTVAQMRAVMRAHSKKQRSDDRNIRGY
jgi:hypothetical protein